jgi:hypothetical protein
MVTPPLVKFGASAVAGSRTRSLRHRLSVINTRAERMIII